MAAYAHADKILTRTGTNLCRFLMPPFSMSQNPRGRSGAGGISTRTLHSLGVGRRSWDRGFQDGPGAPGVVVSSVTGTERRPVSKVRNSDMGLGTERTCPEQVRSAGHETGARERWDEALEEGERWRMPLLQR